MLKLNKTPRMKESAETTRWYMDIALAVNQLVDGVALKGANSDITGLTALVGPGLLPVGSLIFHGSTTLPSGYLKANGALVSRTTYAALFAAIGTTYGVGDGSTTFALPDLRAEFIRGLDDGRGIDTSRAIGSAQASSQVLSAVGTAAGGYARTSFAGFRYHADAEAVLNHDGEAGSADKNTTADATGGTSQNTRNYFRNVRPRNVAMLACIKY